ncbi:MAG: PadR family transcriptional regulator [Armatimonadota bacterium]
MPFTTELVGSTVELIVLKLLAEQPRYGFEIMQLVNERTEGAFNWKEGTLYPVLHRLEGARCVVSEWQTGELGKKRKYYRLTAKGEGYAREKLAEWQTFMRSVNAALCQPAG